MFHDAMQAHITSVVTEAISNMIALLLLQLPLNVDNENVSTDQAVNTTADEIMSKSRSDIPCEEVEDMPAIG